MLDLTIKAGKEIGTHVAQNSESVIKAATNPILYNAGKILCESSETKKHQHLKKFRQI